MEMMKVFLENLHLFNPSSTTFVKHFISKSNEYGDNDQSDNHFVAGYGNTTSAVDAVQFKFEFWQYR
jgi:hypothetical protein